MTNNKTVKIIQITDTHLYKDDNAIFLDAVHSNKTFDSVIERIKKDDLADTDMIFLTGDVSQDGSEESYHRAANALQLLNLPICWIPGNHDDLPLMEKVFSEFSWFVKPLRLSAAYWEFIFLNTKVENEATHSGFLSDYELNRLNTQLAELEHQDKPIAIVMHHPPLKVNTPLMDTSMLRNHDEFWRRITGSKVKLVITGHVHNDYQLKNNEIYMETSPATCVQFTKGSVELQVERKIGYKIYYFEDDQYFAKAKLW